MREHPFVDRTGLRDAVDRLLPRESRRRGLVLRGARQIAANGSVTNIAYHAWLRETEPAVFRDTAAELEGLRDRPLISIVVPCYNTLETQARGLIDSVRNQMYDNWQLCLADGSTDPVCSERLRHHAQADRRIIYAQVTNGGIAANTNAALALADGEFVAFVDHDDELHGCALAEVALALARTPGADLVYTDEDKLSDDGRIRQAPFFKPDWSPELLLCVNYLRHLVVVRSSLVDQLGGLREGYDGAQDYDFVLRATEAADRIVHVPKVLYHWRLAPGSMAMGVGEKAYAHDAGQRALGDALQRRGVSGRADTWSGATSYRPRLLPPASGASVSVVLNCVDFSGAPQRMIANIEALAGNLDCELVVVGPPALDAMLRTSTASQAHRQVITVTPDSPSYSDACRSGRGAATGAYLVFLDGSVAAPERESIDELVGVASQARVGLVAPLVCSTRGDVVSAGLVIGTDEATAHIFRGCAPDQWTVFGVPAWPRNYAAVGLDCAAIRAATFDEVGGLGPGLGRRAAEVSLGRRLLNAGHRNVVWPFVSVTQHAAANATWLSNALARIPAFPVHSEPDFRADGHFNRNLGLDRDRIHLRRSASSRSTRSSAAN